MFLIGEFGQWIGHLLQRGLGPEDWSSHPQHTVTSGRARELAMIPVSESRTSTKKNVVYIDKLTLGVVPCLFYFRQKMGNTVIFCLCYNK